MEPQTPMPPNSTTPPPRPLPLPQLQAAPLPTPTPSLSARETLQQLAQAVPPQAQNAVPPVLSQPPPAYNNIYTEICTEIIKAQGRIMGADMALEEAQGVEGLSVEPQTLHCTVTGDGSKVINDLIQKYKSYFGYAAVEVCREAASRLLPNLSTEQTPALLNTPYR